MLKSLSRGGCARVVARGLVATAVLAASGGGIAARGADPPVAAPEELRPGQQGFIVTVLQGSTPDTLPVEVVGTYPGYSPRSQVVLVRGHGRLEQIGIAHGMSGSPVYIEGRLVGALAFAYSGAREAIGGVTPIGEMLGDLDPYFTAPARSDAGADPAPLRPDLLPFPAWRARCAAGEFISERPVASGATPAGLVPIGLPVALDGWAQGLPGWLETAMRRAGLTPVAGPARPGSLSAGGVSLAAGAGGMPAAAAVAAAGTPAGAGAGDVIRPGDAAAVTLVSGDLRAAAIGTVTWVDGDRVYAFGHPFLYCGQTRLPFARALIAAVIPTLDVSFKIGTPTEEIGVLLGDMRTGVAARLGERVAGIDLEVTIAPAAGGGGAPSTYRFQVAKHEQLTTVLLAGAAASALTGDRYAQGIGTLRARIGIDLEDGRTLERRDIFQTWNPSLTVAGEVLAPATYLIESTFARFPVRAVRVELALEAGMRAEEIEGVRVTDPEVRAGDELGVEVRVREYLGEWRTRRVTLRVPPGVAPQELLVLAGSPTAFYEWDQDRAPEKYRPQNLDDLVRLIETYPTEESLIVRLYGPSRGLVHRGRELPSLPPSKWHALSSGATGGETVPVSGVVLDEQVVLTGNVVFGGTYTRVSVIE